MPHLIEVYRADVLPQVSRLAVAFEGLVPDIQLKEIDNSSLKKAGDLDRNGEWERAACQYYTISSQAEEPGLRLEAGVGGLAQMLINLGKFGQARKVLEGHATDLAELSDSNLGLYYQARTQEKLAWIDGYEANFPSAIRRLESAKSFVESISEKDQGIKEEEILSTVTHFQGRSYLGLGICSKGSKRRVAINRAITYFKQDLSRYHKLREEGDSRPSGEGFQHTWLARCYLELGNLGLSKRETEFAGRFFGEYQELQPQSGAMAHYYLLRGKILAQEGNPQEARDEFEKALEIRFKKEPYPKGEADALTGIAWSYFAEGKRGAALSYALNAIKRYPLVLLHPF